MSDSRKLPVPYQPDPTRQNDAFHHHYEWNSGKRGGGKLPVDFEWRSNPKQNQEEDGVNEQPKK